VTDGIITFPESISYPKIVTKAHNTAITEESIAEKGLFMADHAGNTLKSTLGGIVVGANVAFYAKQGLAMSSTGNAIMMPPPTQNVFRHITNYDRMITQPTDCSPNWKDPREGVMAKLNEFMFRTGVYTAQHYGKDYLRSRLDHDVELESSVEGMIVSPVEVFNSNMSYFAGAASVQLLAILAILITFWGFWDLGRSSSLSPLEIAKAFDAPLLSDVLSNSSGREIEKIEGGRKVRYGAIDEDFENASSEDTRTGERQRLVVADVATLGKPSGRRRNLSEWLDLLITEWTRRRSAMHRHRQNLEDN
jgi:hypothetical protein